MIYQGKIFNNRKIVISRLLAYGFVKKLNNIFTQ